MQIFKNAKMYKTEMEKSILVNSGGIHEEAENRIEKKLLLLKFLVSNCCKSTDICNEYKYVWLETFSFKIDKLRHLRLIQLRQ